MSRNSPAKPPHPLNDPRQAGISRYHQLSTLFRHRIGSGAWAVGQQIPTIADLAAEFGVAIATVRQALDLLAGEGLVIRRKAKGTFVLKRPVASLWQEIETDARGFLRTRGGSQIELLSRSQTDHLPFDLSPDAKASGPYLCLRRRHWRDGRPYAVIDVYVAAKLASQIPEPRFESAPVQDFLVGVADSEVVSLHQTLTIATADFDAARLLQLPLNAPVARIERTRIASNGSVALVSLAIYCGDVVRLDFHEDPRQR